MLPLQLLKFMGRWGNCIGQYSFARSLAQRLNAPIQIPDWIGRKIFMGVNDPYIDNSLNLPKLPAESVPSHSGVALHGYYQFQGAFDVMRRHELNEWLKIKPELMALCPKPRPFYIVCHVRYGDYITHQNLFAVVKRECFERVIKQYGYNFDDVIWLTEENPQPGSMLLPANMRFLYDFMLLMQADVVFRANSTFSFWGAALGNKKKIYSPVIGDKIGMRTDIDFVEGNHSATISMKYHPKVIHSDMHLPE